MAHTWVADRFKIKPGQKKIKPESKPEKKKTDETTEVKHG
jgi:hypothetical protein